MMLSKTILVWSGILLCAVPTVQCFYNGLVSSDESEEFRNTLGQDWEENRFAAITFSSDESDDDAITLSSYEADDDATTLSSFETEAIPLSSFETEAISISSDESDESRIPLDQEWETLLDNLQLLGQVFDEWMKVPLESTALRQEKLTQMEHQMQKLLEGRQQNTNTAARKTLRFRH